ncbi:MAG: MmoB/DmpM family protein [Azospira sp.]|jgi:toluene monooxygenase system protein D|nr:MmoB/DmpM family protein [Azospira sp.]
MTFINWFKRLFSPAATVVATPGAAREAVREQQKETAMSTSTTGQSYHNNMVGPVMRAGDLAMAVIEAARVDNPGKEIFVEDKRAYIRIHAEQEMILRQETIAEELGRPFKINDLEVDLSSFAGQIESQPNAVRFYFTKTL